VERTAILPFIARGARCPSRTASPSVRTACQCIEQLIAAIADIAERDDIHQAAARLAEVQDWISREAEQAASDPIFEVLSCAS